MKELSIEEKAKRYDEALTKARNIINSINVGLIGKDSFEAVFPELKEESDDEKIRKDCIKYLDWEYQHCPLNEDKMRIEKCITWLEKQEEKDEEILVLKDQIESLHAAIKAIKEVHKKELEKQIEQKSAHVKIKAQKGE